ncbi:MAG: D-2-hydroxyacid dehydrogenase, partial [Candidatus Faecousia sp.]|nr:D-2-hydroxyacid dehydrogenase [Candidatus Faecousia sp.]
MKLIVLDGYALNPGDLSYECLNQFGDVTIYDRTDSEAEAISRIGDSEIVLVNKVPITESLLAACPNIRLICVQATGYNVVDCAACARRGIPVTNVPSYGTAAVAQFTMA